MSADGSKSKGSRSKRILIFVVKVAVSLLAFWWVSRKIDFQASLSLISTADPLYLLLGILVFNLSKICSTFRIKALLKSAGLSIPTWSNIKIYYIGAFYNIFLPGSMGGDAYKIFLLDKRTGGGLKKMTSVVFLDRGSGMAMLVVITILMMPVSAFTSNIEYVWPISIVFVVLIITGFYFFVKLLFKRFASSFLAINSFSLITQVTQLLTAWLLLKALSINSDVIDHLVLFMVSGVVSVVPITIGGFGARELVFQWGSSLSDIDLESAVAFTLLFFLVTLISSVIGSVLVFGKNEARV